MPTIPVVVAVMACVLTVAAAMKLKSLGFSGKAEPGKAGRGAAHADPQAQLDQLLDKSLDEIAKAKTDLEAEKELVISCQRRVDQNTAEETRLTNRIKTALSSGDPQGTSKEYALSLAHVREQLASNTEQLAKHKANYEAFAKKVEIGQRQVLEAKQKAKELGVELKESEREAHLSRFAENFHAGDCHRSVWRRHVQAAGEDRRQQSQGRGGQRHESTVAGGSQRRTNRNNKPRRMRFWPSSPRNSVARKAAACLIAMKLRPHGRRGIGPCAVWSRTRNDAVCYGSSIF